MWDRCIYCQYDKLLDYVEVVENCGSIECPQCGWNHSFFAPNLWIVTGASCTGKTSLALGLSKLHKSIVIDADIIVGSSFEISQKWREQYLAKVLRIAISVAQSGLPVVICGWLQPIELTFQPYFKFFRKIYYAVCVCDQMELLNRIQKREQGRNVELTHDKKRLIKANQQFLSKDYQTRWGMKVIPTDHWAPAQCINFVDNWIAETAMSNL